MINYRFRIEMSTPSFFVNRNFIYFQDRNLLKIVNSDSIEVVSVVESEKFVLSVINNCTLIWTAGSVQLLNEEFVKEREFLFTERTSRQLLDVGNKSSLLVNEGREDGRELWLYDGGKGKAIFKCYNHDLARVIEDELLLLLKESILKCISVPSGKVEWELDLVDRRVSKLEIDNDHIIIYAHDSSWGNFGLMVLNISSGENIFSSNLLGPDFYLHNGFVYSVGRNTQVLQVMNKDTFVINQIDLSGELSNFVFETQCSPCFFKDELFVALKEKGQDIYSYWGVIDLNNYKLTFKTEMLRDFSKKPTKNNKTFVSEIKASDKIVGVKVPGNILHIFKKE